MKCQVSFDENYKFVRLIIRAAFSIHCVLPQCNLVAEQIFKPAQSHSSNINPSYTTYIL